MDADAAWHASWVFCDAIGVSSTTSCEVGSNLLRKPTTVRALWGVGAVCSAIHGKGNSMSNIFRCVVAASLLLSLSACVTTNAARLGTATAERPVVPAESVSLYRVASQVPGQYEEVALLNSTGDSNYTNEAKMFDSMRKKAGQMGANAVILDAVSEPGHGAKVAAAIFGVSAQRKGSALAIWVFPGSRATVQAPVPMQPVGAASASSPANQSAPCVSCAAVGKNL